MNDIGIIEILLIILIIVILIVIFTKCTNNFTNLNFSYKLPQLGNNYNIQNGVVPKTVYIEPSSEEPSSEEPSSEELNKNINGIYGNYKLVSSQVNQKSKNVDNILKRLHNASNSAFISL